jgi:hypothetical protein
MEFQQSGGIERLAARFGQRLALLERGDLGQLLGTFPQQRCRTHQHGGALLRRRRTPVREAPLGGLQCVRQILAGRQRQGTDRLARRGVEHRLGLAPTQAAPLTANIEG